MVTVKLNDDTYTELHILKESEWNVLESMGMRREE